MGTPVEERPITTTEMRLLNLLMTAGNKGASIDAMHEALYGSRPDHQQPESRIIPVIICSLRKKIKRQGLGIEPIRHVGYRLVEVSHVVS